MTSYPPILVSMDSNESSRPRAKKVRDAIEKDERFEINHCGGFQFPFDLHFRLPAREMWIELKDFTGDNQSDYLSSILSGHMYEQCLAARELREPMAIVVLGGDEDVSKAIVKAAMSRGARGDDATDKILEYTRMVEGFEANAEALKIRVWRLKENPYKRMLLRVRKILEGGDLTGFIPSPASGERQAVGLSILAGKGIGPAKARSILEHFEIQLSPMFEGESIEPFKLTDCAGIGPKLAKQIQDNLCVVEIL